MKVYIVISILVFLIVLAMPVQALTKGGFEFHLVKDVDNDLPFYISENMEESKEYTPDCLVECHMPIRFRKNTAGDLSFAKSDFSYYYKELIKTTGMDKIEVNYLKNETYLEKEWVSNITCENVFVNDTWQEICSDNPYSIDVLKWHLVWKSIPSSITIKFNEWYLIDIVGYKSPSLGFWALDLVPVLKSIELPEFAWWNSSWNRCRDITMAEDIGYTRTNEPILYNLTGLTSKLPNSDDVRIINASCNDDGSEQDYLLASNTSTSAEVMFFTNISASGSNTWSVYYDYDSATAPSYSTSDWVYDEFTSASLDETRWAWGSVGQEDTWTNYTSGGYWYFNTTFDDGTSPRQIYIDSQKTFGTSDTWTYEWRFNISYGATMTAWTFFNMGFSKSGTTPIHGLGMEYNDYMYYYGIEDANGNINRDQTNASVTGSSGNDQNIVRFQHLNNSWNAYQISNDGGSTWTAYTNMTTLGGHTPETLILGGTDTANGYGDASTYEYNIDYVKPSSANNITMTLGSEETSNSAPTWSSNATSSPTNYESATNSWFNVTWSDDSDSNGYNFSWFESNHSGSFANYSTTRDGNVSYYNIVLGAGTYNFSFYANDSSDAWNQTDYWTITISKADNPIDLYFNNGTQTEKNNNIYQMYAPSPCGINAYVSDAEGDVDIWRKPSGGSYVNHTPYNATNISLAWTSGSWYFKGNTTGDANYSSNTTSEYYNVWALGSATLHLYLNDSEAHTTVDSGDIVNITATAIDSCTGSGIVENISSNFTIDSSLSGFTQLTNNSWVIYNITNFTGSAGDSFTVTTAFSGSDNYTSSSSVVWNVSISHTLKIYAYDELSNSSMTFNVTLSNSSFSYTEYGVSSPFIANATNMPYGDDTIIIWSKNHSQRTYYKNIANDSNETLYVYMLNQSDGQNVDIYIYDIYESPIIIAEIDILKQVGTGTNTDWATIAQGKTDDSGSFRFFLDHEKEHKINVYHSSYNIKNTTLVPKLASYKIYLHRTIGEIPSIWSYWQNITSDCAFTNATRLLECNWTDDSGHLTEIWMNVTRFDDGSSICSNSSTSSNGTMTCSIPYVQNKTYNWLLFGDFDSTPSGFTINFGWWTDITQYSWGMIGIFLCFAIILTSGFVGVSYGNPSFAIASTMIGTIFVYILGFVTIPTAGVQVLIGLIISGIILMVSVRT